jgi:hypothetical protein
MSKLAEKVEQILKDHEKLQINSGLINDYFETVKKLSELNIIQKPTYNFPPTDTLGRWTYSNLNRKK